MSRRSTPQHRRFDDAYPVRLRLRMPRDGWGVALHDHREWARRTLGPGAMGFGATTVSGGEPVSVLYFRDVEGARAFLAAFPAVALADGVDALGIAFEAPPGRAH